MVSRCIATIDQERGLLYSVAVMKNKRQFVSAADVAPNHHREYSWSIKLWDSETRQCVRTFANIEEGPCRESDCSVISLDDESFLCWFFSIGQLVLYNTAIDEYVKIIELDNEVHYYPKSLAIIDRDRFLTGSSDGDVKVWSFESGECQRTLHLEDNNPTGRGVYSISKLDNESFLCSVDGKVLLCNVETGEVMKSFDVDGRTDHIAVVDSERFLTVQRLLQGSTLCTKVNAWNATSGECIQSVSTDSEVLQAIPAGGHGVLLSYFDDANIELRGIQMGNLKRCFLGHAGRVWSMEVVNSTTLISGSSDGTIKIWDLSRWPDLKTLICLRKLIVLGRAEKVADAQRLKRLRDGGSKTFGCHKMLTSLHALVCETSDGIFVAVLSFIA